MRVVLGGCMLFTQTQAAMKNKNQEPWWLSASGTVSWCCRTSSLAHGSKAWAQAALPLSFALLEALPNSPQQTDKPVTSLTCPDEIFPFSLQKMCAVQHCQHWGQQCPIWPFAGQTHTQEPAYRSFVYIQIFCQVPLD